MIAIQKFQASVAKSPPKQGMFWLECFKEQGVDIAKVILDTVYLLYDIYFIVLVNG